MVIPPTAVAMTGTPASSNASALFLFAGAAMLLAFRRRRD